MTNSLGPPLAHLVAERVGESLHRVWRVDDVPGQMDRGVELGEGHRAALFEDPYDQVAQGTPLQGEGIRHGGRQGRAPRGRRTAAVCAGHSWPEAVLDAPELPEELAPGGTETR